MAIKRPQRISRKQLEDALTELRLSVAEVARDTEIPRAYLSDLRNHDQPLRGEYDAKLKDWLIQKEVFVESDGIDAPEAETGSAPLPVPARLTAVSTIRYALTIDERIPDAVVNSALDLMEENDAQIVALLGRQVESGFLRDFDEKSTEAIQEALGLCALNYVVFRSLRGWRVFNAAPSTNDIRKVRDVVFETFKPHLVEAGLIAADAFDAEKQEAEERA
jgi:hypothetical protein